MKTNVLLVDESLTVQKVVALTLDRGTYAVGYAKTRSEVAKYVSETPPDIILTSEQVSDLNVAAFPKEVESWVGPSKAIPPIVLITTQDITDSRGYTAVLRKPFSPQTLQALVSQFAQAGERPQPQVRQAPPEAPRPEEGIESRRLENTFNETFSDEQRLVDETLGAPEQTMQAPVPNLPPATPPLETAPVTAPMETAAFTPPVAPAEQTPSLPQDIWTSEPSEPATSQMMEPAPKQPEKQLWTPPPTPRQATNVPDPQPIQAAPPQPAPAPISNQEKTVAFSEVNSETKVEKQLQDPQFEAVVDRVLSRIVPPIVERLVQQRLDLLLRETEGDSLTDIKP